MQNQLRATAKGLGVLVSEGDGLAGDKVARWARYLEWALQARIGAPLLRRESTCSHQSHTGCKLFQRFVQIGKAAGCLKAQALQAGWSGLARSSTQNSESTRVEEMGWIGHVGLAEFVGLVGLAAAVSACLLAGLGTTARTATVVEDGQGRASPHRRSRPTWEPA